MEGGLFDMTVEGGLVGMDVEGGRGGICGGRMW